MRRLFFADILCRLTGKPNAVCPRFAVPESADVFAKFYKVLCVSRVDEVVTGICGLLSLLKENSVLIEKRYSQAVSDIYISKLLCNNKKLIGVLPAVWLPGLSVAIQ